MDPSTIIIFLALQTVPDGRAFAMTAEFESQAECHAMIAPMKEKHPEITIVDCLEDVKAVETLKAYRCKPVDGDDGIITWHCLGKDEVGS